MTLFCANLVLKVCHRVVTNDFDEAFTVLVILQGKGPEGWKQVGGECSLLQVYL